jgi:hypothetical protein
MFDFRLTVLDECERKRNREKALRKSYEKLVGIEARRVSIERFLAGEQIMNTIHDAADSGKSSHLSFSFLSFPLFY